MARAGENGWPIGTICELVWSENVEYRYQMCETTTEGKQWNDKYGCWTYNVYLYKIDKYIVVNEKQLKWNNFPRKWENWLDNKITLLLNIDPKVAYQVAEEMKNEQQKRS